MKKVSVILTTYNGEQSIEATIQSILNQKGVNEQFQLELIIIDDCSTDRTVELVKQFDVIFYSTTKNTGGPNTGRNIGLKNCTGDFICIADQDDIWIDKKIISLIPHFERVPIVSSGYIMENKSRNKRLEVTKQNEQGFIYFAKNLTFKKKLTKASVGQNFYLGSIMFRKELKNNFFEEHFGMVDFDWGLRLFHQNDSIEVCEALYVRYVEDGRNLSLKESYRRNDFYYSLLSIEAYDKLYPKDVRLSYLRIHGSRARYYYLLGDMKKARFYFVRSKWNFKTLAYYITTFVGSKYVKKKFTIFG